MSNADHISDFLAAVEELRDADESLRITAHFSSVSDDGWPAAKTPSPATPVKECRPWTR